MKQQYSLIFLEKDGYTAIKFLSSALEKNNPLRIINYSKLFLIKSWELYVSGFIESSSYDQSYLKFTLIWLEILFFLPS